MPRPKKVVHRFIPKVHQIAAAQTRIEAMVIQKKVVKDVLKGMSYEAIAEKRHITPEDARTMSKIAIERWATDLGHTATEAKEIDLKRADACLERLHPLVFPEPYIDEKTGCIVQPPPDIVAMKMYKDLLEYRAKMLGTEAAHKLEETKFETLRREYFGVEVNKQGVIDL